jgi:hypothetical protein
MSYLKEIQNLKKKHPNFGTYTFTEEEYQQEDFSIELYQKQLEKIWDIAQENHLFSKNFGIGSHIVIFKKDYDADSIKKFEKQKRNIYVSLDIKQIAICDGKHEENCSSITLNNITDLSKFVRFFSFCIQPLVFFSNLGEKNLKNIIDSSDIKDGDIYTLAIVKNKVIKLNKIFKYIRYENIENLQNIYKTKKSPHPLIKSDIQNIFYNEKYEDVLFFI